MGGLPIGSPPAYGAPPCLWAAPLPMGSPPILPLPPLSGMWQLPPGGGFPPVVVTPLWWLPPCGGYPSSPLRWLPPPLRWLPHIMVMHCLKLPACRMKSGKYGRFCDIKRDILLIFLTFHHIWGPNSTQYWCILPRIPNWSSIWWLKHVLNYSMKRDHLACIRVLKVYRGGVTLSGAPALWQTRVSKSR